METVTDFVFWGAPKPLQTVSAAMKLKDTCSLEENYGQPRQNIKKHITLLTKVCLVKAMVFLVVMYGCKRWTIKKLNAEEMMLLNCGVGEDS